MQPAGPREGQREERGASGSVAEHLKCAPQQDVTEMGANRFDPSHQVAPRNGALVIPLQIQISLPLLPPHPARPVPNAFAHFKHLRKQMFSAAIANLTSHQSVRAEDAHIIFTSVTSVSSSTYVTFIVPLLYVFPSLLCVDVD